MAIRIIREIGDDILKKPCREVKELTPKVTMLIDDMLETMYDAQGVGLAAPQVGVLKRIVVIDVNIEEDAQPDPVVMINPRIVETDGEQCGDEGCLSVPGKTGTVVRPAYVKAEYLDRDFKPQVIEGRELLARAICHELDHLDGKLYVDLVEGPLRDVQAEE